jgi:hypothetical protein
MRVQFGTYDLATEDPNVYDSIKVADDYHQQWYYVYVSYSYALKQVVASIKGGDSNSFALKTFDNIEHNAPENMAGLKFFLGTSSSLFSGINGYYYSPRLFTDYTVYQGAVVDGVTVVSDFSAPVTCFIDNEADLDTLLVSNVGDHPDQGCDDYLKNVLPGTTGKNTLCDGSNGLVDFYTEGYEFAEEYAVHGWLRSQASCDGDQLAFRLVIDLQGIEEDGLFDYWQYIDSSSSESEED